MAAGKGSEFLFKIWDGVSAYATVGGFTANAMTINNEVVDVTTKGASKFRELLEGAGIQSMSLSGDGVFKDGVNEELMRSQAASNALANYEIYSANGDKWQGSFQIASYERSGDHNDGEKFSVTLESAGDITFTGA